MKRFRPCRQSCATAFFASPGSYRFSFRGRTGGATGGGADASIPRLVQASRVPKVKAFGSGPHTTE